MSDRGATDALGALVNRGPLKSIRRKARGASACHRMLSFMFPQL